MSSNNNSWTGSSKNCSNGERSHQDADLGSSVSKIRFPPGEVVHLSWPPHPSNLTKEMLSRHNQTEEKMLVKQHKEDRHKGIESLVERVYQAFHQHHHKVFVWKQFFLVLHSAAVCRDKCFGNDALNSQECRGAKRKAEDSRGGVKRKHSHLALHHTHHINHGHGSNGANGIGIPKTSPYVWPPFSMSLRPYSRCFSVSFWLFYPLYLLDV